MKLGRVARNTFWELGAGLAATAANFLTFVILANGFGKDGYGLLSGTMGIMLLLGPLSAFGAGHLIVRAVNERGESLRAALCRYLTLAPTGGLAVFGILVIFRDQILPEAPLALLLAVGLAELIGQPLMTVCTQAAQAIEELWISAITVFVSRVIRLGFAITYVYAFGASDPLWWGVYHLGAVVIGVMIGISLLWAQTGGFPRPLRPYVHDAGEGLPFGISAGSLFMKNEADKYLLLRLDSDSAAGSYTAGYRILTVAQVPILALVNASYARFFRQGDDGGESSRLAVRLTALAEIYAIPLGVAMYLAAPLLPRLLSDFSESVDVVRWLSVVPALIVAQVFPGQSLTGTGRNSIRVAVSLAAALLNVGLNIWLIPARGIEGALIATIITEALLAVALWLALTTTTPITALPAPEPQETASSGV